MVIIAKRDNGSGSKKVGDFMRLVKVFSTHNMTKRQWETFHASGCYVKGGIGLYTVGQFVREAREKKIIGCDKDEVDKVDALDQWFIRHGALDGETIGVEHG